MNYLTGHILLGKAKLFVIKVPFFSLFTGTVSELVAWLSVDSVVLLFVSNSPSVRSACGVGAGAGFGAGGIGRSDTSLLLSLVTSGLPSALGRTLSPTGTKAEFSAVISSSGVMSLPKLNKASMAILVSSLLAGLVIVGDSFLLTG